jgi:hypothetical protein
MPPHDIIPITLMITVLCIVIVILNSASKKTLWNQICTKYPLVDEDNRYQWNSLKLIRIGSRLYRTNTKIRITPKFVSMKTLFAKPFSIPIEQLVQSSHRTEYFYIRGFEQESFKLPDEYITKILRFQCKESTNAVQN